MICCLFVFGLANSNSGCNSVSLTVLNMIMILYPRIAMYTLNGGSARDLNLTSSEAHRETEQQSQKVSSGKSAPLIIN